LVIPGGGEIYFDDALVIKSWNYRRNIGYLPQIARFPENLKVRELFHLIEDVRGEKGNVSELIELFGLESFVDKRLRQLSGGTRQKVNLVLTFMFDCPVYIMDEPTSGLDPIALIRLKDLIKKMNCEGKTFLVTTHIMSLVEEIADELVFLLEGQVYFKGTYNEMLMAEKEENLERAIANILERKMLKILKYSFFDLVRSRWSIIYFLFYLVSGSVLLYLSNDVSKAIVSLMNITFL